METLIPELYRNYGVYVCTGKMLPNYIDGTIPVWKRILLSAHMIAKNEFVKSAEVFGHTIGNFHPHSEAIEKSARELVCNGFLDGDGNWGSRLGIQDIDCAAPRYTSLRMNKFMEELAFKYIHDVPWIEDELKPEPINLPTMIPLCLFTRYGCGWVAFGFKTDIPNYKLSDLIKRVVSLNKNTKNKPLIVPNIEGCDILSSNEELEKILTTPGKQHINVKGIYTKDDKNFKVYIKGWAPKISFETIFKKIDNYGKYKLLTNGDVSYIDESSGSTGTQVCFEVARARKKEEVYEKLVEAIDNALNAKVFYNIYVVDNDKNLLNVSVDDMLVNTYNNFIHVLEIHFTKEIYDTKFKIEEYNVIEKIKPHISKVVSSNNTVDLMIDELVNLTGCEKQSIARILENHKIKKLLTINTDLTELHNYLNQQIYNLDNKETVCMKMYEDLLKVLTSKGY